MAENTIGYLASEDVGYRDPIDFPPPQSTKLIILTGGGVAVLGVWQDDSNFVAWSPLPKSNIRKKQEESTIDLIV